MLVYITGHTVNGFTLDPSLGTFYLSHPNIPFHKKGKIYSVDEDNYVHIPQRFKDFIRYYQKEKEDKPYTARYMGSLVANFYRNMIRGEIYIYLTSSQVPEGIL